MVPDRQKVQTDGRNGQTTPKLYPSDFAGDDKYHESLSKAVLMFDKRISIYRGSYIHQYSCFSLLKQFSKRDKMSGLSSILSHFYKKFNKFSNTGAQISDSIYHRHKNNFENTKILQCILKEKSLAIYFEGSQFRRNMTFNFIVSKIYVDKRSRVRLH